MLSPARLNMHMQCDSVANFTAAAGEEDLRYQLTYESKFTIESELIDIDSLQLQTQGYRPAVLCIFAI